MNNMSFIKGIGVGVMVGSIAGMMAAPKKKPVHLGKALKNMGSMVDSVTSTLGL